MVVGKFGSQQFVVSSSTILPIGDITISAGTGTSTESAAQGKERRDQKSAVRACVR